MREIASSELFMLALTLVFYIIAVRIQHATRMRLFNPILLGIVAMIAFLKLTGISYETYMTGGRYVDFWLKPAVVALGVPLYRQLSAIRKQLLPLLLSELAGCVAGLISVVLIARGLGATQEVVLSLAPKAVTAPIALEISEAIGGIPSLTTAVVVCTGIFGGMAGFRILDMTHVHSPIAEGLSMGTAAHAVGTAAAMERGDRYGAYSSLGLTLNGLLTAMFAPAILSLLGYVV